MRPFLLLALSLAAFAQLSPRDQAYSDAYELFRQHKLDEAEAAFQKIYTQDPPDLRGLMGLTEVYAARDNYPQALRILEAEMEKTGASLLLKTAWANIAARAGRHDDAIASFLQLTAAHPANFDLHMRLAESYRLKNDLPAAIEVWAKASILNPESPVPLLFRALALDQTGRKPEALDAYTKLLTLDPANFTAANNAAWLLAESKTDLDRALRLAKTAQSGATADPNVADTLAFVFLQRNEPQSAANLLRPLIRAHPAFLPLRLRLAEAASELAAARRLSPSPAHLVEIQRIQSKLR